MKISSSWLGLISCFFCLPIVSSATARTWHVPADAPTIQAGIDSTAAGDTVQVTCGTYFEHDIALKSGITLSGETGDPRCVVLDAQTQGRVLDCTDLTQAVGIAGITLRGGHTSEGWFEDMGGGLRCRNSSAQIRDCIFRDNAARIGAGVGIFESQAVMINCTFVTNSATDEDWAGGGGFWGRDSTAEFHNCAFISNFASTPGNLDLPGDGGGVFCNNTQLTLTDCTFQGNISRGGGGGLYTVTCSTSLLTRCHFEGNESQWGGALYLEESHPRLQGCTFRENTANMAGAILIGRNSVPELNACDFQLNAATTWCGGAVACWESRPVFRTCTFSGNTSATHGGGLSCGDSQPYLEDSVFFANTTPGSGGAISCLTAVYLTLINCTLVANSAGSGGGIFCDYNAAVTLERTIIAFSSLGKSVAGATGSAYWLACCDIYGNVGGDWVRCIVDQFGVAGNFSADPCFCNLEGGDFTLHTHSPCLPGNHPDGDDCGLLGAWGEGCSVTGLAGELPPIVELARAYPNPFNSGTTLEFALARSGHVRLDIFDLTGRRVTSLVDREMPAGWHRVTWRAVQQASGLYFAQFTAHGQTMIQRLVLAR